MCVLEQLSVILPMQEDEEEEEVEEKKMSQEVNGMSFLSHRQG